jgi:hypothetical protein
MRRVLGVFAATFLLGASASLISSGCALSGTCDCPVPGEPMEQSGYTIKEVREYDEQGNGVVPQLQIDTGTIDVTRDTVQIEYDHDGVHHVVLYDVVPGPW